MKLYLCLEIAQLMQNLIRGNRKNVLTYFHVAESFVVIFTFQIMELPVVDDTFAVPAI